MKVNVKITYLTYDHVGRDQYVSTRAVSLDESLREVALSVVNESIGKTKYNWLEQTSHDQPIVFYLEGSGEDPLQGFGIGYGINQDGSIQFLNGYAPLSHNWTLSEIYELRDGGYIKGDKRSFVIATPTGLGGGGSELTQVLQIVNYIVGIYGDAKAISELFGLIRNRALIKRWQSSDLRSLHQIRELLDMKSIWTTAEVKKRLSVSEQFAIKILVKLGYEISGNSWHLGQSQRSLMFRSQWLAAEREIKEKR